MLVKICGIREVEDAQACARMGADWIGINFWKPSPRYCDPAQAEKIVQAVGSEIRVVGLFVNEDPSEINRIKSQTGINWVQLHGNEDESFLERLLPTVFKAARIKSETEVCAISNFPGEFILLDSYSNCAPGGTGETFDWALAAPIAKKRSIILAGGLTPHNVKEAIEQVKPVGVDVASGVESSPGNKDLSLVEKFIRSAKS